MPEDKKTYLSLKIYDQIMKIANTKYTQIYYKNANSVIHEDIDMLINLIDKYKEE